MDGSACWTAQDWDSSHGTVVICKQDNTKLNVVFTCDGVGKGRTTLSITRKWRPRALVYSTCLNSHISGRPAMCSVLSQLIERARRNVSDIRKNSERLDNMVLLEAVLLSKNELSEPVDGETLIADLRRSGLI